MNRLVEEIIAGRRLSSRGGGPPLVELELEEAVPGADRIRSALCGSRADLCTIVNGRGGRCGEGLQVLRPVLPLPHPQAEEHLSGGGGDLAACRRDEAAGAHRFSIVTAGAEPEGEDLELAPVRLPAAAPGDRG